MNEALCVHLELHTKDENAEHITYEDAEHVKYELDKILENEGWIHNGEAYHRSMVCWDHYCYLPVVPEQRDETMIRACRAIKHAKSLAPYAPSVRIRNNRNQIPFLKIDVSEMVAPKSQKLQRYADFYLKTNRMAQDIVVDEQGRLRDGYCTYLLAMQYEAAVSILESWSQKPIRKIVVGRPVYWNGTTFYYKRDKSQRWGYNLREAVVPGDILLVHTKEKPVHMRVSKIEYVTGWTACRKYRKVIKNETADL